MQNPEFGNSSLCILSSSFSLCLCGDFPERQTKMNLGKIGLGLSGMAVGFLFVLIKQAMVVSLVNHGNGVVAHSVVEQPVGGIAGLFLLITWIVGIWLIISGFRSKTAA